VDLRVQLLECGSESTAAGVWIWEYSCWSMVLRVQLLECGSENTTPGVLISEYSYWIVDLRVQLLDCGFESTATGVWIWEYSCWSVVLNVHFPLTVTWHGATWSRRSPSPLSLGTESRGTHSEKGNLHCVLLNTVHADIWRIGGILPYILKLNKKWKRMVRFTSRVKLLRHQSHRR